MIPGDPARVMAGTEADAAGLEEVRQKYGLRDPLPVQYVKWAGRALPRPRLIRQHTEYFHTPPGSFFLPGGSFFLLSPSYTPCAAGV